MISADRNSEVVQMAQRDFTNCTNRVFNFRWYFSGIWRFKSCSHFEKNLTTCSRFSITFLVSKQTRRCSCLSPVERLGVETASTGFIPGGKLMSNKKLGLDVGYAEDCVNRIWTFWLAPEWNMIEHIAYQKQCCMVATTSNNLVLTIPLAIEIVGGYQGSYKS